MNKIIKRVAMFMLAFMLCFSVPAEVPFSTTITSEAAEKINIKNKEDDQLTLSLKPGEKFQIKVSGVKGKVKYKIYVGKEYISVSKKGLIKAKKPGYVYVYVETTTRTFVVRVRVLCKKHKLYEVIDKQPTVTECGISHYCCSVCDYKTGKKKTHTGEGLPVLSPYDVQAKIDSLRSKYPEGSRVGTRSEFNNKLNKDLFDNQDYKMHADFSRLKPGDTIRFLMSVDHVMTVYSIESEYTKISGKLRVKYKITAVESNYKGDQKVHWYKGDYYLIDNELRTEGWLANSDYIEILSFYNPSEEYVIKEPEPYNKKNSWKEKRGKTN